MGLDAQRAGAALGFPGIDPRSWTAHGVVTKVVVDTTGHLVEVELDDGNREMAKAATPYGGDGYGAHFPYAVDDWVAIMYVGGDHGLGAVVVGMAWDGGQAVPTDVLEHPTDVVIVVRPGATCRVIVAGGGDVVIDARDNGRILLGSPDLDPLHTGHSGVVQGEGIDPFSGLTYAALTNASTRVQALKGLPSTG